MTASDIHWDVASYALGVLDEHEAIVFERHLMECTMCTEELASLLPVAGMLGYASPPGIDMDAERERMMARAANVVAYERSKDRARWVLATAAAAVLVLVVSGMAFWIGTSPNDPGTSTVAVPPSTAVDPLGSAPRTFEPSPGFGGVPSRGDRFEGVDPNSGVNAELVLQQRGSGTELTLVVTELEGPIPYCQLVVVTKDGDAQVVTTWEVPEAGFGTLDHPGPLLVQGLVDVPRAEIEQFEIRSLGVDGSSASLVTIWL
jgi:hypothetical protein